MGFYEFWAWYNLVFAMPIGFALVLLILMMKGLVPTEGGLDIEVDHDVSFDHDIGADHELESEVEHDLGHDTSHESSQGFGKGALSVLGVGRCPLSVIFMSLSLTWGCIGLVSNMVLGKMLYLPTFIFPWISMGITFVLSIALTGAIARLIARIIPSMETYSQPLRQLVGKEGTTSSIVSPAFGQAFVKDDFGTLRVIRCHTLEGELPREAVVRLVHYTAATQSFIVCKPEELEEAAKKLVVAPKEVN